jgi:hypothetical protein
MHKNNMTEQTKTNDGYYQAQRILNLSQNSSRNNIGKNKQLIEACEQIKRSGVTADSFQTIEAALTMDNLNGESKQFILDVNSHLEALRSKL